MPRPIRAALTGALILATSGVVAAEEAPLMQAWDESALVTETGPYDTQYVTPAQACSEPDCPVCAEKKPAPKTPAKPDPAATAHAPLFYNNNFAYLKDPKNKSDRYLGDNLKGMSVGPDGRFGTLDVGGQQRLRYHHEEGMGQQVGTPQGFQNTTNDYLLSRTRLYTNWKMTDNIRFYQEGIFAYVNDWATDNYTPRAIDQNTADWLNLFFDVKMTDSTAFRIGRQELLYGNQRLISPLDWANTRRTFEGVKMMYAQDDWVCDTFFTHFVPVDKYDLDQADYDERFYGTYATFSGLENKTIDFFYIGYDDDRPATNVAGARDFSLHTFGSRLNGSRDKWLYEVEGAYQSGRQSGLGVDHSAGFITGGIGRVMQGDWKPTLWVYYDYASGDAPGGSFNRFNQLFPLGHKYFGFIDSAARANISSPNALLTLKPKKKVDLLFWYYYLGAAREDDIIPGVAFQTPQNTTSPVFGNELDLIAKYSIDARQNILLGYSHLWRGEKILGDRDADFTYLQWELNF